MTLSKWVEIDGVMYSAPAPLPTKGKSVELFAFDLDGTLITTLSKQRKFPNAIDDIKLWNPVVIERLQSLHRQNNAIIVFTNQHGLSKANVGLSKEDWKLRFDSFLNQLGFPIQVFVSLTDNQFSKPYPGMWNLFLKLNEDTFSKYPLEPVVKYIGDSAGRDEDYSAVDYLFYRNTLDMFSPEYSWFYTPESFFLFEFEDLYNAPHFEIPNLTFERQLPFEKNAEKEIILMIGAPACGKTTLANRIVKEFGNNYFELTQSDYKTKFLFQTELRNLLDSGKSVVIHMSFHVKEMRYEYIELAKTYNAVVRCCIFSVPKSLCLHLNTVRMIETGKKKTAASVYTRYYNDLEKVSLKEGFSEIMIINKKNFPFEMMSSKHLQLLRGKYIEEE